MNKAIYVFLVLSLAFMSCQRLDDSLFNNDNSISEYKWDEYDGDVDFTLDASYAIADSLMLLFTLESDDGTSKATIYAHYLGDTSRIKTDTVIFYCQGNRDHMDFYWQRSKLLANTGWKNRFGLLTFDYRGYGLSEGQSTEKSMYADAEACLKWLKSKGLTNDRLVIYGFSLGSSSATEIAANSFSMKPCKLILEAPFASSEVMVQDGSLLSIPASFFTNHKIDNAEEIKKVTQPFMWIHGVEDSFLSIDTHGEIVYKNYKGSYSEAHRIESADHGEVPEKMGFLNYIETIEAFITK
jgi:alpha/beta superfamily hydrolase